MRAIRQNLHDALAGRGRWPVYAALVTYTLFFYWKILFTNRAIFPWDVPDIFYPFLGFVHEELRNLRLPLWDPYAFSGFPIIADPMAQIFYPPNWVMLVSRWFYPLSLKLVEIQVIVHYFLAGLFMYWLARDYTKDRFSAMLAGILFMSSGAMVAHAEHLSIINAMAWFPLVFLLARRALLERDYFWTGAAGFFLGIENLAGHWQQSVYLGVLLFLYFLYEACCGPQRRSLWPHWIVQLALIGAIGAGLAMIQIVPTAELSQLSLRGQLTVAEMAGGNDPHFLLTLFLPNYYGGLNGVPYREGVEPSFNFVFLTVPGCILAVLGLVEMIRRRNFFWLGLILICVELSFGQHGRLKDFHYRIPVLNLFRHMPMYFLVANFALCLMAAVGLRTLSEGAAREKYLRWLPRVMMAVFAVAALAGLILRWAADIAGYDQMLLVLGLFTVVISLWPRERSSQRLAHWMVLALILVELSHFSMNQFFNTEAHDPRRMLNYDYMHYRTKPLQFLRSDGNGDFRVANYSGWLANFGNLVRIPTAYGWNPLVLRSYREYVRQYAHNYGYAWADAGSGRYIESPMQDLLGIKYLLMVSSNEAEPDMARSPRLKKVFDEDGWWKIYQNPDYLSRAWYFPRAYVVPDNNTALALINSRWFQARKALIFAKPDAPRGHGPPLVELPAYTLTAREIEAASAGGLADDLHCSEKSQYWAGWGAKGDWQRFRLPDSPAPGRYVLMAVYNSPDQKDPVITAAVQQGSETVYGVPTQIMRTYDYGCANTRSVDLGVYVLGQGEGSITVKSEEVAGVNIYSLILMRLPDETAPPDSIVADNAPRDFSFHDFSVSPNQYAFRVDAAQDGFVLVNEIFYPGWEATIDGRPAEILRADSIFRALSVPAGSHLIEMRFRPRHFWLGASVSLLTLCGLSICLLRWKKRGVAAKKAGRETCLPPERGIRLP